MSKKDRNQTLKAIQKKQAKEYNKALDREFAIEKNPEAYPFGALYAARKDVDDLSH